MAKIMLVEDDNNLREIYQARLQAEGYEVVAAKDGEEALATAVKEKPDLFIADIMMPKISGFDMLDILRSTPETKNAKVIMMTALSQAEDKSRAASLGADKYMVKSQVTLEDVVSAAHELLGEAAQPAAETTTDTAPPPAPDTPAPAPAATPIPVNDAASETDAAQPTTQENANVEAQIQNFIASQQTNVAGSQPEEGGQPAAAAAQEPASSDATTQTDNSAQPTPAQNDAGNQAAAPPLIPDISPDKPENQPETPKTDAQQSPPAEQPKPAKEGHGKVIQPLTAQPAEAPAAQPPSPSPGTDSPEAQSQAPGQVIEPTQSNDSQNPPVLS